MRQIDQVDLTGCTIEHLSAMLEPLFMNYSINAAAFGPDLYLFRGRLLTHKPIWISELGPPPVGVADLGRANAEGETVFYGASTRNIPFFEVRASSASLVVVGCWKTTEPLLLNHIAYSSTAQSLTQSGRALDTIYPFVVETRSISPLNAEIYDFLSHKFSAGSLSPDVYKLSNAISRRLLQEPFGGLMYPAIQVQGNADNIILKKPIFEKALKFVSAELFDIKAAGHLSFDTDVLDAATQFDEEGRLKWLGRPLSYVIRRAFGELTMHPRADGPAGWVAFDEAGKRVDPE
jgi:hypothetical protein